MESSIFDLIAESQMNNNKELSKKQKKNQKKYEKKKMKKQQGNDKTSIENTIDTEEMRLKKIMMEVSIRKLEMKYGKSDSDFARENYGFLLNKNMYKIKDFIIHYIAKNKIEIGKIYNELSYNTHAMHLFLNKDNFEYIKNERNSFSILRLLCNNNTQPITKVLFEELIKKNESYRSILPQPATVNPREVKNEESLSLRGRRAISRDLYNSGYVIWEDICENGNQAIIGVLEEHEKVVERFYKNLCCNPNAINLIKKYYNKCFDLQCLENLCKNTNPEALVFVEPFIEDIDIKYHEIVTYKDKLFYDCNENLCENPSAIYLIEKKEKNIICKICKNPNAIKIIESIVDNLKPEEYNSHLDLLGIMNWSSLSCNYNAIHLIKKNKEGIVYHNLAQNKNGMDILEENFELAKKYKFRTANSPQFISFTYERNKKKSSPEDSDDDFSCHMDIESLELFKNNLCKNPNSIKFLEKYPKYLNKSILRNPNIFEINWDYISSKFYNFNKSQIQKVIDDYKKRDEYLSENKLILELSKEELMQKIYKPSRVDRYLRLYNYDICQEIYCEDD